MAEKKLYRGKPVSSEALDELLENWPIPNVDEDLSKYSGRSTAMGTPLEELYQQKVSRPEPEPEAEEVPMLTLEELEQIRQDAYEEGLKQGHEQGYIEGFDKGVSEGKEAGYKEGVTLGKEQGIEESKPLIEERLHSLSALLEATQKPLRQIDEAAEKQLLQLVNLLAEQVIFEQVKTRPELILQALKKGIDALPLHDTQMRINLHPEDLALVKEAYGEETIAEQHWQLVPEPTLERGGCHIRTPESSIDLSLKNRIAEVLGSFLQASGADT
ncbi:flagellar assembly protein FliH [Pseudoalteromonas rubra]|uniref:Flagellar assembly protein FliH n=1 Tax=Pseudoalteromonas rubra TaxID=43658 RepID=A0A8T0CAJ8_9GAMM|nr:flagellar assembly protein FliH [Pseudoalteromonas rubra]KAF7787091.1 flagellar assembly protein FliH [Pseudoalteromonas rubra]